MNEKEFLERYGKTIVQFSGYYKYVFTFRGANGFSVAIGGDHNDIYRCEVTSQPCLVESLVQEAPLRGATIDGVYHDLLDF